MLDLSRRKEKVPGEENGQEYLLIFPSFVLLLAEESELEDLKQVRLLELVGERPQVLEEKVEDKDNFEACVGVLE